MQYRKKSQKISSKDGLIMGVFELVSALFLILSCIFIIVIVFFQGSQKGGMSQTITGQSSDNYYQRNMGRSKEIRLKRLTAATAVLFFAVAFAVNLIAAHFPDGFGAETTPPPVVANGGDDLEIFDFDVDDFMFGDYNDTDDDSDDENADSDDSDDDDVSEEDGSSDDDDDA